MILQVQYYKIKISALHISDKDYIEQIKTSLIESEFEKDARSCGIYCAKFLFSVDSITKF